MVHGRSGPTLPRAAKSAAGRALRGHVLFDGRPAPFAPSAGCAVPFRSAHCEGAVYLAHRPAGRAIIASDEARLRKHENCFELQIQARLRAPPRGTVFISGELYDEPMKLSLVKRPLCHLVLAFVSRLAARRGVEVRYSFGDAKAHAHMAGPALAVNRVVVSETELPLPVDTIAHPGTWRAEGGNLRPIDRSAARYGEGQWVTVIVGCPFVSADDWRVVNIPGIGSLELAQFLGSQDLHMVLYDGDAGDRRELCHINLSSTLGPAPELPRAGAPCPARATEEVEDTAAAWTMGVATSMASRGVENGAAAAVSAACAASAALQGDICTTGYCIAEMTYNTARAGVGLASAVTLTTVGTVMEIPEITVDTALAGAGLASAIPGAVIGQLS